MLDMRLSFAGSTDERTEVERDSDKKQGTAPRGKPCCSDNDTCTRTSQRAVFRQQAAHDSFAYSGGNDSRALYFGL